MLNDLKVSLVGRSIDFIELNNFMKYYNYHSIAGVGAVNNAKYQKSVYYTNKNDQDNNVLIIFDVLSNNYLNDSNNFYLEITNIKLA